MYIVALPRGIHTCRSTSALNFVHKYYLCVYVGDSLKTLDQAQFGKWSHYLNLKASVYNAYVSCYTALKLPCPPTLGRLGLVG